VRFYDNEKKQSTYQETSERNRVNTRTPCHDIEHIRCIITIAREKRLAIIDWREDVAQGCLGAPVANWLIAAWWSVSQPRSHLNRSSQRRERNGTPLHFKNLIKLLNF
jgi:hypothetical protein